MINKIHILLPNFLMIFGGIIMVLSYVRAELIGYSVLYPPFSSAVTFGLIVAVWGSIMLSINRLRVSPKEDKGQTKL